MAFQVVAVEKEAGDEFVHLGAFGKRKGLAHESPQALTQGVIEALEAGGGTAFGVGGAVLGGGQDVVVALQMVSMEKALR